MLNNNAEKEAIHEKRPIAIVKTKKPEQILVEVRNKKMAELNMYKTSN